MEMSTFVYVKKESGNRWQSVKSVNIVLLSILIIHLTLDDYFVKCSIC